METTTDRIEEMKSHRNKVTRVSDVIDRIMELRKVRDEAIKELKELEGAPLQTVSPIPSEFEYKTAIVNVFDKANTPMNLDAIVAALNEKHGFMPDRAVVAIRVGYLADSANPKQLERVEGRRGYYRKNTAIEAHDSNG